METAAKDFKLWEAEVANPSSMFWVGLVRIDGGREPLKSAGYSRVKSEFILLDDSYTNADPITFPECKGEWGVIMSFGIWAQEKGGKRLYRGPLSIPHVVTPGDFPYFGVGNLLVVDCNLDNLIGKRK